MFLTNDPDFLSVEEAFTKKVKTPTFIMFGGDVVGRKVDDEVFFEYRPNETLTLFIKSLLKTHKARVIQDYYNQNRQAFVLMNGHRIFFAQDPMTYSGHTHHLLFPKIYTSDFKDLSVAHNVLQVIEGKKTEAEVNKIYQDVEEIYRK
jgi:hypothetical protein